MALALAGYPLAVWAVQPALAARSDALATIAQLDARWRGSPRRRRPPRRSGRRAVRPAVTTIVTETAMEFGMTIRRIETDAVGARLSIEDAAVRRRASLDRGAGNRPRPACRRGRDGSASRARHGQRQPDGGAMTAPTLPYGFARRNGVLLRRLSDRTDLLAPRRHALRRARRDPAHRRRRTSPTSCSPRPPSTPPSRRSIATPPRTPPTPPTPTATSPPWPTAPRWSTISSTRATTRRWCA